MPVDLDVVLTNSENYKSTRTNANPGDDKPGCNLHNNTIIAVHWFVRQVFHSFFLSKFQPRQIPSCIHGCYSHCYVYCWLKLGTFVTWFSVCICNQSKVMTLAPTFIMRGVKSIWSHSHCPFTPPPPPPFYLPPSPQ